MDNEIKGRKEGRGKGTFGLYIAKISISVFSPNI